MPGRARYQVISKLQFVSMIILIVFFALPGQTFGETTGFTTVSSEVSPPITFHETKVTYPFFLQAINSAALEGTPSSQGLDSNEIGLTVEQKSLLLAGWGQVSKKQYTRGTLFLVFAVSSVTVAILYNEEANKAYEKYQDADNIDDIARYRDETEENDTKRNQALVIFSINHLINILDIYLSE